MFISKPHLGMVYAAEQRRRFYRWWTLPYAPTSGIVPIGAPQVPLAIRRQAYRYFHQIRKF